MLEKEISHDTIMNDLLNQVSELADMRTGFEREADMLEKTYLRLIKSKHVIWVN